MVAKGKTLSISHLKVESGKDNAEISQGQNKQPIFHTAQSVV